MGPGGKRSAIDGMVKMMVGRRKRWHMESGNGGRGKWNFASERVSDDEIFGGKGKICSDDGVRMGGKRKNFGAVRVG